MENTQAQNICLRVSGRITASVTHEIKNTLSIINENAGLLEDLCLLSPAESGIPPARVENSAKLIMKQVTRSNTILKNLNSYAHSGDAIPARASLHEMLTLMVDLSQRQAASRKITVAVECSEDSEVQTNLLFLDSLLYAVLCEVYSACPQESNIEAVLEKDASGQAMIRLSAKEEINSRELQIPGEEARILVEALGYSLSVSGKEVVLLCPENGTGS